MSTKSKPRRDGKADTSASRKPKETSPSESSGEDEEVCEDEPGGIRIEDIYIPPAPRPACTLDTTGPRLIITHIENENFKSYAGKQVLGPLHKSFTSIVGPNGSGKSNVIDSMLFVFGYRAAKIRSKKISVLLHNSEQHQNVRSCTVTVHFQLIIDKPGEDFEVVPDSQIAVSRTAFKDNSSFYTIGGRRVQFKEVAKLLQEHGIDLDHNRFLILQGEVEQIAMMKPIAPNEHETGMLEFLEDIIGTKRFKEPLKQLFNRVEQLTEEKADKLTRVKMVEKEKDALEVHKNEAIQYLQTQNDITEVKNGMCQKQMLVTKKAMAEKEEKKKAVDEALAKLQGELDTIHEEMAERNKTLKAEAKLVEELAASRDKLKALFDEADKRDMTLQEDIKQLSVKRKKTKGDLKKEREKLHDLERIPEKNTEAIAELVTLEQTLSKECEKEEAAKDKLMAGLAVETKGLKESKNKLEDELIGLKEKVDETKSANDITKKELELYLSNEQKEQSKLEQIHANHKRASETVSSRKPQMAELKAKIPALEVELRAAHDEFERVAEQERTAAAQLRSARASVEETRSSMQATRSKGRVLDFLMKQKADGKLPGIFGRLGDLGAIDKKYDIAVSTACWALDHILVDTNETGQECIRLLKQHDVGRANFIILNKQDSLLGYCNTEYQYPENVVRLFDLIRIPDQRVRTAFYFGCKETLVASDMDQATRIGYGQTRYRVVTLKGELIETSGTMSGGGRPSSGRMGQAVAAASVATPGQVEKMQRNVEELEARAAALRQSHDRLQATIKHLPTQLKTMQMDLKKYSAEIQSAAKQEPVLREQLARQEERVRDAAPDPREVKRLQGAVAVTQAAFDVAAAAADKVGGKVKKLHAQIMEMTGGRVAAAQKRVNDVTTRVEKVRQEMTKLKVAIKTSERNAGKSKEKIANMEQEISDAEERMLAMQDEIKKIVEKGAVVIEQFKARNAEVLEREERLAELKQENAGVSKREVEVKSSKLEVEQKVGAFNKDVDALRSKTKVWNHKLKELKLHKIPGIESEAVLKVFTEDELADKVLNDLEYDLQKLEEKILGKVSNFAAIEEYQKKEAQYLKRVEELEEMTTRRTEMRNRYEELRKMRLVEFLAGYNIITSKLKEMYQMITLGGDAELELVDSLDPFSEGVIFSVRPPKKSWKNIANLSGGEKTLSSLALVFALHYYKPSPLYVMDEIDAALDFKNVSIVGHYIKERTKNAQFIIISLRANMFELADRLIGIFKTHNATKSIAVNPRLYGKQPGQTATQIQRMCTEQSNKQDSSKRLFDKTQPSTTSQKSSDQQFQALFDQRKTASKEKSPDKNAEPVKSPEQKKRKSDGGESASKKVSQK